MGIFIKDCKHEQLLLLLIHLIHTYCILVSHTVSRQLLFPFALYRSQQRRTERENVLACVLIRPTEIINLRQQLT